MEFSILVPVYRAEQYLEEAVLSVLRQDFSDYELILAEDGSPDGSGAVMDRLAAEYPERIRVIHLPHQGTVKTRRAAIAASRGDYILWLDADDTLSPDSLSFLHDALREHQQPDILIYEYTAFFEDGRPEVHRPPLFADGSEFLGEEGKKPLYELLIRGNLLDSLCIKLSRAELFREDPSDYTEPAKNPYGEDVMHFLYPVTQAKRIVYRERSLYGYRICSDSVMHEFDEAALDKRFNESRFGFFAPFMKAWGMADEEHFTLLKASAYKTVLDGILYFLEEPGYDKARVKAYSDRFVSAHPELKKIAASSALSVKQRVLLGLFARKKPGLIEFCYKLRRLLK